MTSPAQVSPAVKVYMRCSIDNLPKVLARGLDSVYCISGDELLQRGEAAEAVRACAVEAGYTTRELLDVDARFDWQALASAADSQSLFAERRIIELRLPSGKPGKAGGDALRAYLNRLPEETILLIVSGKVDAASQKSAWFKALDKAGVCVAVWPPRAHELVAWVARRLRRHGVNADTAAAQLIAERTEGNLLAADQEIQKLALLVGDEVVDARAVMRAVADSARFSVFDFSAAVLAGDVARASRTLTGLRAEGVDPVPVAWALTRDVRDVSILATELANGRGQAQAMQRVGVAPFRQREVQAAVHRHSAGEWQHYLHRCAALDLRVKRARSDAWDALLDLSLAVAGRAPSVRADVYG
ncbi:MAG: DNA polymerase III subunit delta [Pseudomonadota bacterium]